MQLRPYQKEAVDATLRHFRNSVSPACVVLPTGAGKSLIIAELAHLAHGRVLVLAHVKELCEQNFRKYLALREEGDASRQKQAGLYSAGLGQKDSSHPVTFASVQSVARNLQDFEDAFSLLVIDECHRVSGETDSQYGQILVQLRKHNPSLKVLGLTATPYRLGMGWAYQYHYRGFVQSDEARPFESCIYEVSLRTLIDAGYITRPEVENAPIAQYDFSSLEPTKSGEFPEREVNELLVRHRRVTRSIVEQVVRLTEERKRRGTMLFAATVAHAREIASYLPPGEAALVLGDTVTSERDAQLRAFLQQRIRYLVNVAVLTTGFDAPHVDLIAILRPTESVGLYQQILGRGLRRHPGKKECLVIDYAGNGYDPFSPEIGARKRSTDSVAVNVACPKCAFENQFWGVLDADGAVVEHFGRRCQRFTESEDGARQRCSYRFRFKECEQCAAENDIAARRCGGCDRVLTDPDDRLKRALGLKDALILRVAAVSFTQDKTRLKVTYHDDDGSSVSEWFDFNHPKQLAVFNRVFSRRLASGRHPLELQGPEQALRLQGLFPVPAFVVARRAPRAQGAHFRIQERIFDYEGRFRTSAW